MLTDKAKIDFEKWLFSEHRIQLLDGFNDLPIACQYALIIEWFESIGFHIGRDMIDKYWVDNSTYHENKAKENEDWTYDSISDLKSISEAIQKANELYNTTHP